MPFSSRLLRRAMSRARAIIPVGREEKEASGSLAGGESRARAGETRENRKRLRKTLGSRKPLRGALHRGCNSLSERLTPYENARQERREGVSLSRPIDTPGLGTIKHALRSAPPRLSFPLFVFHALPSVPPTRLSSPLLFAEIHRELRSIENSDRGNRNEEEDTRLERLSGARY